MQNEKDNTGKEGLQTSNETLDEPRLERISSKKLLDLVNLMEKNNDSPLGSQQQVIDLPDTKYAGDDLKKSADNLNENETNLRSLATEIVGQLEKDLGSGSSEKPSFESLEENKLEVKEKIEEKSILSGTKDTPSSTLDSVCEQCIIDDVKATLHRALDEISKTEKPDLKIENEEIVVHVGSTTDVHGLGIKIIPKVPDLKEFFASEIIKEPEKPEVTLPEPEIVEVPTQAEMPPLPRWMVQPPPQPNCPYGLEFLSVIDTVRISQTKMLPFFSEPSFIVTNQVGQNIYEVDVRANCFSTFVCASKRRYEMSILNGAHIEVMHFTRPSNHGRLGRRCLEVYAPFDTLIGRINEGRGTMPFFIIMDSSSEVLFRVEAISGPPESKLYTFGIMPTDGDSLVGKIRQETSGTLRKVFRENCITVNFYINLDAKLKALIMGCGFLIDLIYLEIF